MSFLLISCPSYLCQYRTLFLVPVCPEVGTGHRDRVRYRPFPSYVALSAYLVSCKYTCVKIEVFFQFQRVLRLCTGHAGGVKYCPFLSLCPPFCIACVLHKYLCLYRDDFPAPACPEVGQGMVAERVGEQCLYFSLAAAQSWTAAHNHCQTLRGEMAAPPDLDLLISFLRHSFGEWRGRRRRAEDKI